MEDRDNHVLNEKPDGMAKKSESVNDKPISFTATPFQ